MLEFQALGGAGRPLTILCIGAHCDDIEIGCSGTVLALLSHYPGSVVWWVVLTGNDVREQETRTAARRLLGKASSREIITKRFRNGYFPYVGMEVKDFFEDLKQRVSPDVVFTHFRNDLHQDHRVTGELTWNTFRDHLILEYEVPKYDGGLGSPNLFVPLSDSEREEKVRVLMECFPSQQNKQWFTRETFTGLMRLRGIESNSPSGYAEAFYCRKAVLAASNSKRRT